jgi:hypothetical protein
MSSGQKAPYSALLQRYEALKKQYFTQSGKQYDDEGQEMPSAFDRGQLVQQFENMGVELPLSPNYPLTFVKKRGDQ